MRIVKKVSNNIHWTGIGSKILVWNILVYFFLICFHSFLIKHLVMVHWMIWCQEKERHGGAISPLRKCVQKMLFQQIKLKKLFHKNPFRDFGSAFYAISELEARDAAEGLACHQLTCVRHTKVLFNEFYIKKTFLKSPSHHTDDQLQIFKSSSHLKILLRK